MRINGTGTRLFTTRFTSECARESVGSMMLAIAGIGIVLYSASMFLGVTDQGRVPRGCWSVWPLTADRHSPKFTTHGERRPAEFGGGR